MPAGLCVTGAGFESWTHPDLLCAFGVPLGYGFTCRTGLRRMDRVSLASEELMGREHLDEGVGWECPEALAREAQEPRLDSQVCTLSYPPLSKNWSSLGLRGGLTGGGWVALRPPSPGKPPNPNASPSSKWLGKPRHTPGRWLPGLHLTNS